MARVLWHVTASLDGFVAAGAVDLPVLVLTHDPPQDPSVFNLRLAVVG